MSIKPPTLPLLPADLQALYLYLQNRDLSPPSAVPVPETIQTSPIALDTSRACNAPPAISALDTITWSFKQPEGIPNNRRADGFIVAYENRDTGEPVGAHLKVSIEARSLQVPWPNGSLRSYAIAAYRNTWQGEARTPFQTRPEWQGHTAAASGFPQFFPMLMANLDETIELSGPEVVASTAVFPRGTWPLGGFMRVEDEVTGPTSWQMGVRTTLFGDSPDAWGEGLATAAGTTNRWWDFGVANMSVIQEDHPILIKPDDGQAAFTGGRIFVCAWFIDLRFMHLS